MEAPEMFRVIGKRKPEFVQPYLTKLEYISTQDCNRVVRIHANGAIKATLQKANQATKKSGKVIFCRGLQNEMFN